MENKLILIKKCFVIIILAVFSVYGCAGVKTEQKSEEQPVSPIEEKVEQPTQKEEVKIPQPPPEPTAKPSPPPAQAPAPQPPKVIQPTQPAPTPPPPLRTTKIIWDSVNLRQGPGLNYKVIGNVKKGTSLSVLEDQGNWLKVRLKDGKEAWVTKAATLEAPKPPPAAPQQPKPM